MVRKTLVLATRRAVAYPVEELKAHADELQLSDPMDSECEPIAIGIPSALLAELPSDLSVARLSPMLTMGQARRM